MKLATQGYFGGSFFFGGGAVLPSPHGLEHHHACSCSKCQMVRFPRGGMYINMSSTISSVSWDDKFSS